MYEVAAHHATHPAPGAALTSAARPLPAGDRPAAAAFHHAELEVIANRLDDLVGRAGLAQLLLVVGRSLKDHAAPVYLLHEIRRFNPAALERLYQQPFSKGAVALSFHRPSLNDHALRPARGRAGLTAAAASAAAHHRGDLGR